MYIGKEVKTRAKEKLVQGSKNTDSLCFVYTALPVLMLSAWHLAAVWREHFKATPRPEISAYNNSPFFLLPLIPLT